MLTELRGVISIRAIGKRASPMHITAYFSMLCMLLSPPFSLATDVRYVLPRDSAHVLLLPVVAISGFAALVFLTLGLQRETAGRGTLGMYVQLVFAVVLDWVVFDVIPRGLTVLGMGIIVVCALYVTVRNNSYPTATTCQSLITWYI
jgi:drug/metabolite transporter (DMT)-like permease